MYVHIFAWGLGMQGARFEAHGELMKMLDTLVL